MADLNSLIQYYTPGGEYSKYAGQQYGLERARYIQGGISSGMSGTTVGQPNPQMQARYLSQMQIPAMEALTRLQGIKSGEEVAYAGQRTQKEIAAAQLVSSQKSEYMRNLLQLFGQLSFPTKQDILGTERTGHSIVTGDYKYYEPGFNPSNVWGAAYTGAGSQAATSRENYMNKDYIYKMLGL